MIAVEQISEIRELPRYKEEWKELVSKLPTCSVFDTYEWVKTWLDSFWTDKPISFLFFRQEGSLVGIAPFVKDLYGELWCSSSLVSPINSHSYRANVVCEGNPAILFDTLFTFVHNAQGCHHVAFPLTLSAGAVSKFLPDVAKRHRRSVLVCTDSRSPIIRLNGAWDAYLKTRSRHMTKEVRRKIKRCENAGHVERVIIQNMDQCDRVIRDIFLIDEKSWKGERGTALGSRPDTARFYAEFASGAAKNGWLRLHLLYVNSQPVAFVYGVVFQNQYYALKTSYDATFREVSPGIVLFDHVFRYASEQGFDVLDLLGIESRWKNDFANDYRQYVNVCVFDRLSVRCHRCRLYRQILKPFVKDRMPIVVRAKTATARGYGVCKRLVQRHFKS
jgi:hypothetical protein